MTQKQIITPTKKSKRTNASDQVLRAFAGYSVRRTASVVHTDINRRLKHLGLRMISFSVLTMIDQNPDVRQANLAQALGMERPNLVSIVSELEKSGWVTRIQDPTDRRAYGLRLTRSGRNVLSRATAAADAHEAMVIQCLSEEERHILIHALIKIEDAIKNGG